MLDLSSLEIFAESFVASGERLIDRRQILKGVLAAGAVSLGASQANAGIKVPDDPLGIIREKRMGTLTSVVRAQVDVLWGGYQGDNACQISNEILTYASYLPHRMQHGINVALLWLDLYSIKHAGGRLKNLSSARVREVLNQGEYPRRHRLSPPLIRWEEDNLLHLAVSGVAMLGRMVIHSRNPARDLIGLGWSEICEKPTNLVSVEKPPLADLSQHYDVVIIGSGAGGATMANRLTAAGKRVLIIDLGDFIPPDALIQKVPQPDGSFKLAPPRSDEVLYRLYKDAGGQIAGGLGTNSKLDLALPARRKRIPVRQSINVCQAKVFGGGPYVNNAIHLPIPKDVYEEQWIGRQPEGVSYDYLSQIMTGIQGELGVNTLVTDVQISDRSLRFKEGCEALGQEVLPLPVAMRKSCLGCGSDNSVDSFGDHIGGIHPYKKDGFNSFLVQAMNNAQPAEVSYRTTANRIRISRKEAGDLQVDGVDVHRVEESGCHTNTTVTANQYVVAGGVGATTKLLSQSLANSGLRNQHLGKRLTANVGTAVYAMFDKPIWPSGSGRPEPGVTQCFLVDKRMVEENGKLVEEPALENWFHFPGTVALALCGWFKEFACVMRKFNHLSMSGIVVPTDVRCTNYVDSCGKFHLEFNTNEFEMLLRGMRRIAQIYFAAAKEDDRVTLYLPTKSILMRGNRPAMIRSMADFEWALCQIRKRGPAYINLLSTHPQGGASLGDVVDTETFQVKTDCGERVENLTVSDATLFPAGCEINPQLTVKALSTLASQQVAKRLDAAS